MVKEQSSLFTHCCPILHPPNPRDRSARKFFGLDLKDAFSCISLHPDSQYPFAFEGKDTDTLKAPSIPGRCFLRVLEMASMFLEVH